MLKLAILVFVILLFIQERINTRLLNLAILCSGHTTERCAEEIALIEKEKD